MGLISKKNAVHYRWGGSCDGWHLVQSEQLSVIQERVPPGGSEIRHRHIKAEQFFFVLSGVARIEVAGKTHHVQVNEGVHIPAGLAHQLSNSGDEDLVFLVTSTPPSHGDREAVPDVIIRDENAADAGPIAGVIEAAFQNTPHTSRNEQLIVKALRDAGVLTISQVAVQGEEVVGHVAVSPVRITGGSPGWYGLGPIAVLPAHQGQGVGAGLMRAALRMLKAKGANGCVLLGDPGYYERFGFRPIKGLVLAGVPPEYFQALVFKGPPPKGEVIYHNAFEVSE